MGERYRLILLGGLLDLMNHGILKRGLFMGVGMIDDEGGRRDIGGLSGMGKLFGKMNLVMRVGGL